MIAEILTHLFFLVVFFVLGTFVNFPWIPLELALFWLGGLAGTILIDLDHMIYVFLLRPYELTSQRTILMLGEKRWMDIVRLLYRSRSERKSLVFHSIFFEIVFVVFTFWVVTSSQSMIGKGVVLGVLLHLIVDQIVDKRVLGNLNNWGRYLPIPLTAGVERGLIFLSAVIFVIFSLLV